VRVSNEHLQREARRAKNTLEGKFPVESWPLISRYALDLEDARQRIAELEKDAERLNALEALAQHHQIGGLLLHHQHIPVKWTGVGLGLAWRSLREAIDGIIAAQRQKEGTK